MASITNRSAFTVTVPGYRGKDKNKYTRTFVYSKLKEATDVFSGQRLLDRACWCRVCARSVPRQVVSVLRDLVGQVVISRLAALGGGHMGLQ